jgi:hypothetical protein
MRYLLLLLDEITRNNVTFLRILREEKPHGFRILLFAVVGIRR